MRKLFEEKNSLAQVWRRKRIHCIFMIRIVIRTNFNDITRKQFMQNSKCVQNIEDSKDIILVILDIFQSAIFFPSWYFLIYYKVSWYFWQANFCCLIFIDFALQNLENLMTIRKFPIALQTKQQLTSYLQFILWKFEHKFKLSLQTMDNARAKECAAMVTNNERVPLNIHTSTDTQLSSGKGIDHYKEIVQLAFDNNCLHQISED